MSGLLVLGAGRHQAPLIERAEARGIRTIALDYYDDSPGKQIASAAVLADALDVGAVMSAARSHHIDAIATVGTDQALPVIAAVAEELSLPCHISVDGAFAATHKARMRTALEACGVPMTVGAVVSERPSREELAALPIPCVVKAADSQGQRGMQRIDERSRLAAAIEGAARHSRTSTVVVEQFANGPELTINAWMRDGEPVLAIPADRHTFNPPPAIGICLRHVVPSHHAARTAELTDITRRVANGYGISDGPLYIQLLVTEDGFRVVEAASRVGGGHEAQLFEEMYGLSLLDLTIDLAYGRNDRPIPELSTARAGVVNFVVATPGRIAALSGFGPLVEAGVIDRGQWYVAPGHEQPEIVDSMGRIGAFIVTGQDRTTVLDDCSEVYQQLHVTTDEGDDLVFWPDASRLNQAE